MDEMPILPGVLTVVQARMNASRLPGKALLPLGQSTVLEQTLKRVAAASLDGPTVVVLPAGDEDKALRRACLELGVPYVEGSETDVLGRILKAAHQYDARLVVRCQASHPLLDPKMLWAGAQYAHESGMDLVTVARLPHGVASEAMPTRTLERLAELTDEPFFREQVTVYTSLRPDLFERAHLPPPPRLCRPEIRLALETEADYWLLKRLYDEVAPDTNGLLPLDDVIAYIDAHSDLCHHHAAGYAVARKAA